MTVLKLIGCLHGSFFVGFIFFGFSARSRVDFFQLADRKWRLFRIFSGITLIKINQIRFSLTQLCDDQSHLQPPVSKMYIPDHLMAHKTSETFDALTDDRRTQMSDMQRFCHVWSAVVQDDLLWMLCFFYGKIFICLHLF